jgi:hypothetical protein
MGCPHSPRILAHKASCLVELNGTPPGSPQCAASVVEPPSLGCPVRRSSTRPRKSTGSGTLLLQSREGIHTLGGRGRTCRCQSTLLFHIDFFVQENRNQLQEMAIPPKSQGKVHLMLSGPLESCKQCEARSSANTTIFFSSKISECLLPKKSNCA